MLNKIKKTLAHSLIAISALTPISTKAGTLDIFENLETGKKIEVKEENVTNLAYQHFRHSNIKNVQYKTNEYTSYYEFSYEVSPGKTITLTSKDHPRDITVESMKNHEHNLFRDIFSISIYEAQNNVTFLDKKFINEYTPGDLEFVYHRALSSSDNYAIFLGKLHEDFNKATQKQKMIAMDFFYQKLNDSYDESVSTGHSHIITQEDYFQALKNKKNVGNCTDISCRMLEIGDEVFGLKGIVITKGSHYLPIYKLESGKIYSPSSGVKRVTNNLYELLDSADYSGINHIIANCDELFGELQTYLQKEYEKEIMPNEVTSFKDLQRNVEKQDWKKDFEMFFIGNQSSKILGIQADLTNNYDLKAFRGEFAISGFLTQTRTSDNSSIMGVSFYNDFSQEFDIGVKNVCGNFTKAIFERDINEFINKGGSKATLLYQSEFYCLTTIGNNFQLVTSLGIKPEVNRVADYSTIPYVISEIGFLYQTGGISLDIFSQKFAQMQKSQINASYSNNEWKYEINLTNTEFENRAVEEFVPQLQKQLKISYGENVSFGISDEGGNKRVQFSLKIPFTKLYK